MKKILSILILLLVGFVLVACDEDGGLSHQTVFDSISITYQEGDSSLSVTQNITLPSVTDFEGVTIEWLSQYENIISTTGVVNRPIGADVIVTLTLQVTINGETQSRGFNLTVKGTEEQQNTFYTVSFDSTGGSNVANLQVLAGGLITKPTDPTRTGFEFEGWYKNQARTEPWNFATDTVNANTTLYANWTSTANPTFTVTFNVNGGSIVTAQTVAQGGLATAPTDPTRTGFVFDGWFKDAEFAVAWNFATDTVTANTILYAKWIPAALAFTVSFESNGGSAVSNQTVEQDNLVTQPDAPTRDGYLFNGWFADAEFILDWNFGENAITANTTLYAQWYPEGAEPGLQVFTVTFDSGSGTPVPIGFAVEDGLVIEPNDPERFGYSFEGWFADAEFTTEWNFATDVVTENITLYAFWFELPPAMPTPIGAIGAPIATQFVAIGAYTTNEGYGGSIRLRFTNIANQQTYFYQFTHPAGAPVSLDISTWVSANLPAGTYSVTYQMVANGTTHSNSDWWPGSAQMTVTPSPLAQPVAQINDGILTWNEVINATSYDVIVGDQTYSDVTSPFDLTDLDLAPGLYAVTLVANPHEGYAGSQAELELLVPDPDAEPLAAPTGLNETDGILTWNAVANAVNYTITMDGETRTTANTTYDLSQFFKAGSFDVTVRANGDGAFYLNSPQSEPLPVVIEAVLNQLNAPVLGSFIGDLAAFITSYSGGHRNIDRNGGHPVWTQEGLSQTPAQLLIRVFDGDTFIAETTITGFGIWHVPSGAQGGPFSLHLTQGRTVHLILVGNGTTHVNSAPLIVTLGP